MAGNSVIVQTRVSRHQLAGLIFVLAEMRDEKNRRDDLVDPTVVCRRASRAIFEEACSHQRVGQRDDAYDLLEQAECVSELLVES